MAAEKILTAEEIQVLLDETTEELWSMGNTMLYMKSIDIAKTALADKKRITKLEAKNKRLWDVLKLVQVIVSAPCDAFEVQCAYDAIDTALAAEREE